MRPIKRIEPFLDILGGFWKEHPDLRFGQMVEIIWAQQKSVPLFYIEDKQFLGALKVLTERQPPGDPRTLDLFNNNKGDTNGNDRRNS